MRSLIFPLLALLAISAIDGKRPRPAIDSFFVVPTVGQPWPKPQTMQITQEQYAVHPGAFHFLVNSTSETCDLLTSAFDRYYRLIFFPQDYMNYVLNRQTPSQDKKKTWKKSLTDLRDTTLLKRLNVQVQQPCEQYPTLESDESCKSDRALNLRSCYTCLLRYPGDQWGQWSARICNRLGCTSWSGNLQPTDLHG